MNQNERTEGLMQSRSGFPVHKCCKAQVSVEYLVVIGIALGVLVPGVMFFYSYSQADSIDSTTARINDIGLNIISTVKSTYAHGIGTWESVDFVMPESVTRVTVNGTELVFIYSTKYGDSESVFFSSVPIMNSAGEQTGVVAEVHPGSTRYRVTSTNVTDAQGRTIMNLSEIAG